MYPGGISLTASLTGEHITGLSWGPCIMSPAWECARHIPDVEYPRSKQEVYVEYFTGCRMHLSMLKPWIVPKMPTILLPCLLMRKTKLPRHETVLQGHIGMHKFQRAAVVKKVIWDT